MKKRIAFIYYHNPIYDWEDGLREVIKKLEKYFEIDYINLFEEKWIKNDYDLYLGWGAINSPADNYIRLYKFKPAMLFVAGCVLDENKFNYYDNLFIETRWFFEKVKTKNKTLAFGYNNKIYKRINDKEIIRDIDYIYPAAFASWKRHDLFVRNTSGKRIAIGEIQKNDRDCIEICRNNGVIVLNYVHPKFLAYLLNCSKNVYIPSEIMGGGERAVLEGLACGCNVIVENEKLKMLLKDAKNDLKNFSSDMYFSKVYNVIKKFL